VDQAQHLEEVYFAVPCLFNDFDEIRRLQLIVVYILMAAVETSKLTVLLAPKQDAITSRLLAKAAGVVRRCWRKVRKKLGLIR
jgi:hypothetical protein